MRKSKFLFILLLFSCNNQNWHSTISGLHYRIIQEGKGTPVAMGTTVKIYFRRSFKDSTVFSNFGRMPDYVQLIPGLIPPYGPEEALLYHIKEGDSLQILQRGDSLLAKGILKFLNHGALPSDEWITNIRVVKVFPFQADSLLAADKQKEKERLDAYYTIEGPKAIDAYLRKNKVTGNPEILLYGNGDTSRRLLEIKILSLANQIWIYRDSVPFMKGTLPQRIDSSILHYSRGARLRYYLPSMDAFGAATPAGIPSYSDLIFDITIK